MIRSIRNFVRLAVLPFGLSLFLSYQVFAQGSAFTYQGSLNNNNIPGNGNFDFEFKLFDALNGGAQQGATLQQLNVPVTNGSFSAILDFGANAFPGAARFLELSVRPAGGGAFTTLAPRQQITATPYAIRSTNASAADGLSAACVGCVTGDQIQGGGAYIQNTTSQQAGANFNISGDGTVGGTLSTPKINIGNVSTSSSKLTIEGTDGLQLFGVQPTITMKDTGGLPFTNYIKVVSGSVQFNTAQSFPPGPPVTAMTIAPGGLVGIGTTAPQTDLHIVGLSTTEARITSPGNNAILALDSTIGGTNRVWTLENGIGGNAGRFAIYDRTAGKERLSIGPNSGLVMVQALGIMGGADFSENFDVAAFDSGKTVTTVEPGMVVSIDPATPGKLTLSTQAYDRRVAGIISGAGGVKTGMIMSQEGTLAHGSHPVALSGRVYCLVDASYGPVEPGDLLTTSDTTGYAMKAADPTKAQGAILGKAMTGLQSGKGLVLVLVTLQ